MKINWQKYFEEIRILFIIVIIAFTIKSTLVEIYVVPTGSMEDTIETGDVLLGNKFIYGMRTPTWIGLPWTRIGINIPWRRLPEFKKVKNGDVTIFEFPRDPFQKYVKRCIGIPGDSIYINTGVIIINNDTMDFPQNGKYLKGYAYGPDKIEKMYSYFNGNRDNLDNFIVPYKGMEINFLNIKNWQTVITLLVQDGNNVMLGSKQFTMIDPNEVVRTHGFLKNKILRFFMSKRKAVAREQKDRARYINKLNNQYKKNNLINPWHINYNLGSGEYLKNNLIINGKAIDEIGKYYLKRNYYFFMGDNRDSSYDSRFWGFVPDSQILGTPLFALVNMFNFKLRMKVIS